MKRLGLFGLVLMAVLGLSAFMASTASAENAPYWSINGTRLGLHETHNITAKSFEGKSFVLSASGSTTTCTAVALKEGVLLGSAEGEPGLNNEVLVFTGCTAKDGANTCTVTSKGGTVGTIQTVSLKSELVEDETGKKLLLLLQPASGTEFVTLVFTGSGCTPSEAKVTGSYVLRVLTDNSAKEDPELETTQTHKQGTSWLLETQTPQPER
jgi:hypothetical protein